MSWALSACCFVSALVGLFLWASRNGDWRMGMTVKWGASPESVVLDLHRSVGIYSAAFLLVTLFTGVAMIFKPATRDLSACLSPVRPDPDFGKSTPLPGRRVDRRRSGGRRRQRVFPDGTLH